MYPFYQTNAFSYIFPLMLSNISDLPLLLQGLGTFQLHSQAALRGLTPHSVC